MAGVGGPRRVVSREGLAWPGHARCTRRWLLALLPSPEGTEARPAHGHHAGHPQAAQSVVPPPAGGDGGRADGGIPSHCHIPPDGLGGCLLQRPGLETRQ